MLTVKEKETLKTLADEYMEIASLPVQNEKIDLWKALNRGSMIRPMVAIDQLPWHELNYDGSLTLTVTDPFWRRMENTMRQTIYKWKNFPADMVIEPVLPVPMAITGDHYDLKIKEDNLATDKTSDVLSHRYHNQLNNEGDLSIINDMNIVHDIAETNRRLDAATEMFDGIIPVRPQGLMFSLGSWDRISTLMGVEDAYISIMDRPEFIHKIMRRFTDATIKGIHKANELNLYDGNANCCHCSYIYTDEMLPGVCENNGMKTKDSWAFGLAQLFSSVSPAVTEEFELPYVTELALHFGGIYYGCCDRLDDRIDIVKKIPNVRKLSCSPWSDRNVFAERIGPRLVMSAKPSPAFIAGQSADYETVKKDLTLTVEAAKRFNVNLELILKDISTVNYEPKRITNWNEIAMETVGGF